MRCIVAAIVLTLGAGTLDAQQVEVLGRATHVVVPQRSAVTLRLRDEPIRIEGVHARVKIVEQAATTTLEIALRNPGRRQAEAVLLLPVPAGAAVDTFAFEGPAPEATARLLPKDEARRLYNDIVAKTRDPALLEFAGYNLVRTSLFPVPAGGTQKVRLSYHHLLTATDNRVDYVLPRSEALDVQVPWTIEARIESRAPIATVYSPSHELTLRREGPGSLALSVKDREPGPFRLAYLRGGEGVSASLFAYPDPKVGGGYFLLVAGLPPHAPENKERLRREVTIVIDRSGSMAGLKLDQVKAAAVQVFEGLDDGEAFNLIDYGNDVAMMAPAPVVKDAASTKRARGYLQELRPRGGTNIHDALVEALRQPPREGMLPLVLFLTDGLPTIGQTSEAAIKETVAKGNPHRRRVFTFGVGQDVNAPLLDRVAEMTRGSATYVMPGEDVEVKVAGVFQRLYGPVLADAKLTTRDPAGALVTDRVREPIPAALPDLFEGDQLVVLGQYRGEEPLHFRLEGNYLGRARTFGFEFRLDQATTRNAFVPRLWASRRIAFLVDQIRQAGGAEGDLQAVGESLLDNPRFRELVDEIMRLSTEFGILSEYTSFLATEGTDLSDWDRIVAICGRSLDSRAVGRRWGDDAISQAKNVEVSKKAGKLNYYNKHLDNLRAVEVSGVQQVNDRCLFQRGKQWIDGRLVAGKHQLAPDLVVEFGTPAFFQLVDQLVTEGRPGVIAFKGEILLRVEGKTVLVRNDDE